MRFVDIHAHIQQHDPDELEGIVSRAENAGVGAIVVSGVTVEDSRRCIQLAEKHPMLFAGVGVHPTDLTGPLTEADLAALDEMARHPKVVVMSEVGIDHQSHVLERPTPGEQSWESIQEEAFRQQIEIAGRHRLPVVFHVREPGDDPVVRSAWPVAVRALRESSASDFGGAAHYFQGDMSKAVESLDAGFMVSFARPLLRLKWLQEVGTQIPFDRIVLESDSYPQPFKKDRTKWTEPWHVQTVAERLARLRGVTAGDVAVRTTENALSMLGDRGAQVRSALEA